jgi:hypothetical protein
METHMDPLQPDIDRATRRAAFYWMEDGLSEILSGGVFLLLGAYFYIQTLLPPRGVVTALFAGGFPLLIIGSAVVAQRLVRSLKDKYVHPRTGYVGLRRQRTHRALTGFLGGSIAALLVVIMNRSPLLVSWLPALEGLILGAAFLWAGKRTQLVRFPVEGLLAAGMGLLLAIHPIGETLSYAALFAWLGLIVAIPGVLAFRSYLRHAPPPEEA